METEMIAGPILTLLAVMLYGVLHSLLATNRAKRLAEVALGSGAARLYRLFYNIVGGLSFLPVLAITAAYPGMHLYTIPLPWTILSTLGQVLAVALLLAGLRQTDPWHFLGLRQLTQNALAPAAELTTGGIYRYVRHPLYSAGLLFIWLTPVMTTSVLALNLGISVYLYLGSVFEERRLVREFGPAYIEYRKQVPRLIPRLWMRPRM
jgi:protein-S-isoprenylcysteine O-methyltransferase Ste14